MKDLSRRAFLVSTTALAGTMVVLGLPAVATTPKESAALQAKVDKLGK